MSQSNKKNTKNRREQIISFIYVTLMFVITTVICCFCLFYYKSNDKILAQKEFAISKMDRIKGFQDKQKSEAVIIDSIYSKIYSFNPAINASYEENDIKYYLNDIESIYNSNSHDDRYKIFQQVSNFYRVWFVDKKELWVKNQNIASFRKNLEECEIGLQKKKEELKNNKR